MRLIKAEDVCEMLDIIADSKAITTKHGAIAIAKTALDDIPTIDPESLRPQGEWIRYHEADLGWDECGYRCSNCKWKVEDEKITFPMDYCPNCGARMKKDGDLE